VVAWMLTVPAVGLVIVTVQVPAVVEIGRASRRERVAVSALPVVWVAVTSVPVGGATKAGASAAFCRTVAVMTWWSLTASVSVSGLRLMLASTKALVSLLRSPAWLSPVA